jgi:hypothetical protein
MEKLPEEVWFSEKPLRNLVRPEEGLLTVTRKAGLCVY